MKTSGPTSPGQPALPERVYAQAKRVGTFVSEGIPAATWNGLTEDTFELGAKDGSTRTVHLLPEGLHPVSKADAEKRFAWNPRRRALWAALERAAPTLREYGVTHLAGGGSFFSTDAKHPGDVDLIAFVDPDSSGPPPSMLSPNVFGDFNRMQSNLQIFDSQESIFFPGGPSSLYAFLHAPPNPRPARPSLSGPKVGLALLDLAEF